MKSDNNRKMSPIKDYWGRLFGFLSCALIVLGVYFVFMLLLNMFAHKLFVPDENDNTFFSFLGKYGWGIIYALVYAIPLYFIRFRKDNELKTFVLHVTENDYDVKNIFGQFTLQYLKTDVIIYALYSALLLLPFKDVFDNPAWWITYHQFLFYTLTVPRIISYICAIIWFIVQYYACFWFVHRYWIKNRLHKNNTDTVTGESYDNT